MYQFEKYYGKPFILKVENRRSSIFIDQYFHTVILILILFWIVENHEHYRVIIHCG